MVNVGGPSKGCLTCIQRKIRCDRQRPICGQCVKSSRQCGGYRSAADLIFRHQSQTIEARSNASTNRVGTPVVIASQEGSHTSETNNARDSLSSPPSAPTLVRSLRLDAENGLITFFIINFTCNASNRGTNLFQVPNNFDDLLKNNSTKHSVQSVGAMALARLRRSSYYFREAQKLYGQALLTLAELLRQNTEIDKDAVLFAILFLGFFEVLVSDLPSSRQSWMTHLGGLSLLLKRRKDQVFNTGLGARMLLQSRGQAITNALQTKTPVAEEFRALSRGILRSMPTQMVHSDDADMLLMRLAHIQAQFQSSGSSTALISELVALDDDCREWHENLPPAWSFITRPIDPPSELWWEARCDLYPMAVLVAVHNRMRAARIIICNLIQEAFPNTRSHTENTLATAVRRLDSEHQDKLLRHLVIDICATVPPCYRPSRTNIVHAASEIQPPLGTCYWLLWPLEVVGSMREAPPELTKWARQCLEHIYEMTGIVKAWIGTQRLQEITKNPVVAS